MTFTAAGRCLACSTFNKLALVKPTIHGPRTRLQCQMNLKEDRLNFVHPSRKDRHRTQNRNVSQIHHYTQATHITRSWVSSKARHASTSSTMLYQPENRACQVH